MYLLLAIAVLSLLSCPALTLSTPIGPRNQSNTSISRQQTTETPTTTSDRLCLDFEGEIICADDSDALTALLVDTEEDK
jgi:hypothetical protein